MFKDFRAALRARLAGPLAHGSHFAHLAYFAAVFVEGHGFYAMAGGVLLGFGLLALALGAAEGD